ncbi:MAG: DegT/DnrJ/EryC1/StrS aminotransferase, partial [candidate division CPR1 bacterium GW2011_GWA2_42_17]
GGALAVNNKKLAEKIGMLRMYGEDRRYHSVEFSAHSRLDEIQSAILRVRIKYLGEELIARQKLVDDYRRELPGEVLIPQKIADGIRHANHLFVIRLKDREKIQSSLKKIGIETAIHYPAPIHLVPAFSFLGYERGDFPVSESASRQVLSLRFSLVVSGDASVGNRFV